MNKELYDENTVLKVLPLRLKEARKANGLTIYNVAQSIGKTPASISLWEKGKALPDVNMLLKLCKLYHLESIEDLLLPENSFDKESISKSEISLLKLWRNADKKARDAAKLMLKAGQK